MFGVLQIFVAIYAFFVLTNLIDIVPTISTLGTFTVSFIILLVPTMFLGAVFPLAGSIFKRKEKEPLGLIYSSDLAGAIIGTFVAGFILIPMFGNTTAILFGILLNILSAFIILTKKHKIIPAIVCIMFISVGWLTPSIIVENTSEYDFYSPSPYGLVSVKDNRLYVDERQQCGCDYPEDASERMIVVYCLEPLQGQLDVLNIGLGCGLTLEKIVEYDTNVDVVEINYQVVLANKVMSNILLHPQVNLIVDEGLHYLRYSNKKYDSIIIDIENPLVFHSSDLYTVEAFEVINQSLKHGGTFGLWCFNCTYPDWYLRILYYTLKESFNYVYYYPEVFLASNEKIIDKEEYMPIGPKDINTIDRKILADAFMDCMGW